MKEGVSSRLLLQGASTLWAARGSGPQQTPVAGTTLHSVEPASLQVPRGQDLLSKACAACEAGAMTPGSLAHITSKLRVVGQRVLSHKSAFLAVPSKAWYCPSCLFLNLGCV